MTTKMDNNIIFATEWFEAMNKAIEEQTRRFLRSMLHRRFDRPKLLSCQIRLLLVLRIQDTITKMSLLPNFIVSASNLVFLYFTRDKSVNLPLYFPMVASIVYHLAEVKHRLIGFPILNKYASELLWIDRIGAFYAAAIMLLDVYHNPSLLTRKLIVIGAIGFAALAYSEMDTACKKLFGLDLTLSHTEFVVSHCIWHLCAMKCFSYFV